MKIPLPTIGISGVFKASAPFDTVIKERLSYTVTGLKTLSEIISNAEDPFKLYYEPYGISEDSFRADLKENTAIITLAGSDNSWNQVPHTYIISYPDNTGIPYHVLSLAITLGAMPVDYQTTSLETAISNLVTDTIGVVPSIVPVEVSGVNYLTEEEHQQVTNSRETLIQNRITDTAKYRYALEMYHKTLEQLKALECHITNSCGLLEDTSYNQALKVTRDFRNGNVNIESVNCSSEYRVLEYSNTELGTQTSYRIEHYRKNTDQSKTLLFRLDDCKLSLYIRDNEYVSENNILRSENFNLDHVGSSLKISNLDNQYIITPTGELTGVTSNYHLNAKTNGVITVTLPNGRIVTIREDSSVVIKDTCRTTIFDKPDCGEIEPPVDIPIINFIPVTLKDFIINRCNPNSPSNLFNKNTGFVEYKELGTVISYIDPFQNNLTPQTLEQTIVEKYYPSNPTNAFSNRNCTMIYKELGDTGTVPESPIVTNVIYDITTHSSMVRFPLTPARMYSFVCKDCYL